MQALGLTESSATNAIMSLGPILGSGGLAIMIPPSAIAVLLGAVAGISVGRILIGIIVPGLLLLPVPPYPHRSIFFLRHNRSSSL